MNNENTITLEQLRRMPVGQIAALNATELARLQTEAARALESAKLTKDLLDGVLGHKYADRAALLRKETGKEHGIVRFIDGDLMVIADQRKDVKWDQNKLTAISSRISAGGGDPDEYIKTIRSVDERKYSAWPAHIQKTFMDARTVRFSKQAFRLEASI